MKKLISLALTSIFLVTFITGCGEKKISKENENNAEITNISSSSDHLAGSIDDDLQSKLDIVIKSLEEGFSKYATIEYEHSTKSFNIKFKKDTPENETLISIAKEPNLEKNKIALENNAKSLIEFSNIVNKNVGEGYSIINVNPIDESEPSMFKITDGVVTYPILK